MATNEQMKIEFSYFGEVWMFFKKYYYVESTEEFWESVVEEVAAILHRSDNSLKRSF